MLADQVGLDFFGIGEHHTGDFPMPAADVVLAASRPARRRIHLGSAVTVLSSDDPVRVFQRYSTLDRVSGGGRRSSSAAAPASSRSRSSATTSRLRAPVRREDRAVLASCSRGARHLGGTTRAALHDQDVVPHPERAAPGLDRRRRQPGVRGPRRAPRVLADARDHRRPAGAVRPLLDLFQRRSSSSDNRRCRSASTRPATSPRPTSRLNRVLAELAARRDPGSPANAASGRQPSESFAADVGPEGALYVGAPERSRRRSLRTWTSSTRAASTSSSASPASPTTRS